MRHWEGNGEPAFKRPLHSVGHGTSHWPQKGRGQTLCYVSKKLELVKSNNLLYFFPYCALLETKGHQKITERNKRTLLDFCLYIYLSWQSK